MPKHAVTADGEAVPAGNILTDLRDMLKSGDVGRAVALLDANSTPSLASTEPTKKTTDTEVASAMVYLLRIDDILYETKIFTDAIYLAAAGLDNKENTNAIQLIACEITDRLAKARDMLDEIREKPTNIADPDPSKRLEAIQAEKARRAAFDATEEDKLS